ncbi:endolytic transglycosylase MltG [Lacticaseibacillus yichunensis]|uniref:Endolytic murein transglycosylase n=1 Tax=Lacticaseibacillus yichunensis TaxID=2486015 RepID=A0ABW4CR71_9LACO|nr:endolytic transglycosylase MltG [Lacticaseibacillus yichunensis]
MDNQTPNDQGSRKKSLHQAESRVVNRIVLWVVGIVVVLLVIVGLMGYRYVKSSLEPVNEKATDRITVHIPIGSSTKEIGATLQNKKIIKSATVFNYYVKFHSYTNFKAGDYTFTQANTLQQIVGELRAGSTGDNQIGTVLVKEGVTVEQIGDVIEKLKSKNANMSKEKFLDLMKNETFFAKLAKDYPKLLTSAAQAKDVRYRLEGYLFPATYTITKKETLKTLVAQMVQKTDSILQQYYTSINKQGYKVQEVMTLASLVEREGSTANDRRTIAGVFLNRLAVKMPLQSDISVMYALNTHKTHLTNTDTAVDSPYNLYVNTGYGPGPFDSPSEASISAVLSPLDRDKNYLYFVANLKTGEILYATTREAHDANVAKFAADNGQ